MWVWYIVGSTPVGSNQRLCNWCQRKNMSTSYCHSTKKNSSWMCWFSIKRTSSSSSSSSKSHLFSAWYRWQSSFHSRYNHCRINCHINFTFNNYCISPNNFVAIDGSLSPYTEFYSLWFDPIRARTHDLLHTRRAR
jgi:hypothetical protein